MHVQTFGAQHILDLLGEVSNRALKAMWCQKWIVHRALRPIAYGGLRLLRFYAGNTQDAAVHVVMARRLAGPIQCLTAKTGIRVLIVASEVENCVR